MAQPVSCAEGFFLHAGHQGSIYNPFLPLACILRHDRISTEMFYIKYKTEPFFQNHQPPKFSRNVNSAQKNTQTKIFF